MFGYLSKYIILIPGERSGVINSVRIKKLANTANKSKSCVLK